MLTSRTRSDYSKPRGSYSSKQSQMTGRRRQIFRLHYSFYFGFFFVVFAVAMILTEMIIMNSDDRINMFRLGLQHTPKTLPFGRVLKASNIDPEPIYNRTIGQQPVETYPLILQSDSEEWSTVTWECFQTNSCPWQKVNDVSSKFFVYSAYWDDHTKRGRFVRIVGVAKTKRSETVFCKLGYHSSSKNQTEWVQTSATVKVIRENWNLKYTAVFITCDAYARSFPDYVAISSKSSQDAYLPSDFPTEESFNSWYIQIERTVGNVLKVQRQNDSPPDVTHELSVCVKPIHYEYDKAEELIEFIELHRILGVTHFTFYNHTVGPRVNCVLKQYIKENLVTVLPWHRLDIISQKEIRTEGIFASLNDCLYRRMHDSQHLLFIDFDEFILPRSPMTLTELLRSFNNRTKNAGAFYFRNAFFYLQWPDDPEAPAHLPLTTLKKTLRNAKPHPHRIRSKYICRPKTVVEVGNHFVWEFVESFVAYNIPETAALVHHYRTCEFGGNSCLKNPSVTDKTAFHYRDPLVGLVQARLELLDSCILPTDPPTLKDVA